jgi:DNA-binding transcriptional MerR regulator
MFWDDLINNKGYTADELESMFQSMGKPYDKLTKRTIYYYAYEKNLFPIAHSGKGGFTEREIGYLKLIAELKDQGYALEEIRSELDPNYREYRMKTSSYNMNNIKYANSATQDKLELKNNYLTAPRPRPRMAARKPVRSSAIKVTDGISLLISGEISGEKLMRIVKAVEDASKD